jgi:hypothetical protein
MCNSTCINPLTDHTYCGASAYCSGATAGAACSPGQTCVAGVCSPTPCSWTQVAYFPMTSQPAGSSTNNGAIGSQGVQTVFGRSAWYQSSDWNSIYIPPGLLAADDTFAAEVEFYVPTGTSFEANAGLGVFTTDLGGGNFSHGVYVDPYRATNGTFGLIWRTMSGQIVTVARTTPMASFAGQWRKLRVQGTRSTCSFKVLVDGTQVDSWTGACDLAGPSILLHSWSTGFGTAVNVAWSNLYVYKGTPAACAP